MNCSSKLGVALVVSCVLAWSGSAFAANCANGKLLYSKKVGGVEVSCSQSSCHGASPTGGKNNINQGANPANIEAALDTVSDMSGLRSGLGLTTTDIQDIADWIFFAPTCPASAPALTAVPSSLGFGSVVVPATSAAQSVTVTNTGTANATGITRSNSNAAEFLASGTCTTVTALAVGASCTLTVSYKPSAVGADTASYTLNGSGGSTVTILMTGTGAAGATASLQATPGSVAFGSIAVGSQSGVNVVTITNSGGATATGVSVVNSNAGTFPVSSNTCGSSLGAGASCAVSLRFQPTAAGAASATLTVGYSGGSAAVNLSGTGTVGGPAQGQLSLPVSQAMADQAVGTTSAPRSVTITNTGVAAVAVASVTSSNATEFPLTAHNCSSVGVGGSCTVTFTFQPNAAGARTTSIIIASNGLGSPQALIVTGNGIGGTPPPPSGSTSAVVEYYHASFDHYFVTAIADEITKLDNGTFVGWARTGRQFKVYPGPASGLAVVCRFFSTAFGAKSSHFYTANDAECTTVKSNPNWQFEAEVFSTPVPAFDGSCADGNDSGLPHVQQRPIRRAESPLHDGPERACSRCWRWAGYRKATDPSASRCARHRRLRIASRRSVTGPAGVPWRFRRSPAPARAATRPPPRPTMPRPGARERQARRPRGAWRWWRSCPRPRTAAPPR